MMSQKYETGKAPPLARDGEAEEWLAKADGIRQLRLQIRRRLLICKHHRDLCRDNHLIDTVIPQDHQTSTQYRMSCGDLPPCITEALQIKISREWYCVLGVVRSGVSSGRRRDALLEWGTGIQILDLGDRHLTKLCCMSHPRTSVQP
ncbi:hypothetical protein WAI453_007439 [Rhynchosporium graminicola]